MPIIDRLSYLIDFRTDRGSLDRADRGIDRLSSSFNSLGIAITGALSGLGAYLSFEGIKSAVEELRVAGTELGKLSELAGITNKEFQELAYVMQQRGLNQDQVAEGLKEFNLRLIELKELGTGPAGDALSLLGLDVNNFIGLGGIVPESNKSNESDL